MGNNNNSMFNITFDRTQPTIYYTGDTISGQVQFTVPERTNKIEDMYLTVTGDVGYTTIRTTRTQNGQTDRITDRHDVTIFAEKVLLGQPMSSHHAYTDSRFNDMTMIEAGQYKHPFSIRLPDILPPTIHPQDYPFVRYEVQLCIDKKWYCANTRLRYPLRIHPRVNLLQISNSQCAVKFDTKRKDIIIYGIIKRSGHVPGEQLIVSLDIYNPNHLAIKRVDMCLIQRYEIEQCRRRLELVRVSVPQLSNSSDEHIETTCQLAIPLGIPPSYHYKTKGGRSGVHVSIHYDVKLEVKAKGLFSDFDLQVPVIIGTDSAEHSCYDQMTTRSTDLNAIDTLEVEIDDDGISPPSYDSLSHKDSPVN